MNERITHPCFQFTTGQLKAKQKLSFHLDAFKMGASLPFYLFVGAKGFGKNQVAKALAKGVKDINKDFSAHLINCATIKNIKAFKEQIYDQKIDGRHTCLLLDECHNLPDIVQQLFLSAVDVSNDVERVIHTDDGDMRINTRQHVFIFMTSEPDALFAPLKDRLETIVMAPYTQDELAQIVLFANKKVKVSDEIIHDIADHLRGNPRSAVKMAHAIEKFCLINGSENFGRAEWENFKIINDISPHALDAVEIEILRVLAARGDCSLNDLRAATGLSRNALMNNHEVFLMHKNFMRVDQKRKITEKGRNVLLMVDRLQN